MTASDWTRGFVLAFEHDGRPAASVLAYVLITSRWKNRFCVGPVLSDAKGEIGITAEMMAAAIADAKAESPMDYSGGIADCLGIEVVVEDGRQLKQRQYRLAAFYPDQARTLAGLIERSSNARLRPLRVTLGAAECRGRIPIVLQIHRALR